MCCSAAAVRSMQHFDSLLKKAPGYAHLPPVLAIHICFASSFEILIYFSWMLLKKLFYCFTVYRETRLILLRKYTKRVQLKPYTVLCQRRDDD